MLAVFGLYPSQSFHLPGILLIPSIGGSLLCNLFALPSRHSFSPCVAAHAAQGHSGGVLAVLGASISPVAILPTMTAAPITSAGRFSPFGPFGILIA